MQGRPVALSLARRFVDDLSWISLGVPLGVIRKPINIAVLRDARAQCRDKPPWTLLFARAYAFVAREQPELRRFYVRVPRRRLHEAATSVATIMMEREWRGERALFPARLKNIGERPLTDLVADFGNQRTAPIESLSHFRRILTVSRLPTMLRRPLWWYAFHHGDLRPGYFGTFGLSILGQSGATIVRPVSPLTNFVGYGPFAPDGGVELTMAFDHRVMDGGAIVDAMASLEAMLNGAVADEVRQLALSQQAADQVVGQIHQT
jgi:hypothetical protein